MAATPLRNRRLYCCHPGRRSSKTDTPGAAVLPFVPYGVSEHYRDFPFTVSLRFETEIAIIGGDIPESLHREGIRHVFILNGHDGNIAPIEIASRKVKAPHPEMKIATFGAWWESIAPLLPKGFFEVWEGLGHGGEGETSISPAPFEELCQMEHAAGRMPDLPEFGEIKWLFSEITDCGATGDPTKGSSEKGLVMKKALVDAIILMLKELNTTGWRYGYKP